MAISYTVLYSDSSSGKLCGSDYIQASNCTDGFCGSIFKILSSLCPLSSDINVTIFAITTLGVGPMSNSIKEGLYTVDIILL